VVLPIRSDFTVTKRLYHYETVLPLRNGLTITERLYRSQMALPFRQVIRYVFAFLYASTLQPVRNMDVLRDHFSVRIRKVYNALV
jgi:hypothetical protein